MDGGSAWLLRESRAKKSEREKKSTWLLLPADKEAALSLFPASDRARITPGKEANNSRWFVGYLNATRARVVQEDQAAWNLAFFARAPGHTS